MNEQMTITIASVPDREGLVAELWYDNEQWEEIFQESDRLRLALYPNPNQTFWDFDTEDAAKAIREAGKRVPETAQDNGMRLPEAA